MSRARGPVLTVVLRGLRIRCPACGLGHVFRRGLEFESVCSACGWPLERCPGHWIGGTEIGLVATFTAGVAAWSLAVLAFGLGPVPVAIATAASGVFSVVSYRPSRGVFLALDYLIDPSPDLLPAPPSGDADRGPGRAAPPPAPPRDPRGSSRAAVPAASPAAPPAGSSAGSSESFIPPPAAPYPPPATVSP